MKVVDGEIEFDGDEVLRRAQLIKVSVQTLEIILGCLVATQFLLRDDVKAKWKAKFQAWKVTFFGNPPLTEEQIREAAHQVNIEAARILRSVDES